MALLVMPFGCIVPKDFKIIWFSNISTVVRTKFDIYVFINHFQFIVHDKKEDPFFYGSSGYYVVPGHEIYASVKKYKVSHYIHFWCFITFFQVFYQ